jgi:D-alanyl-D-alanine carboxypeptidase/D-alanyl-D-alanine-endopeptidase (penicillin-binding protein 4)
MLDSFFSRAVAPQNTDEMPSGLKARRFHWKVAVAALCACVPALAAEKPSRFEERESLRRALSEVLDRPPLKGARTSMSLVSLDDGEVVFSHRADDLLNPASNVKLFTSAAALTRLGPEFRFETEFWLDGEQVSGKPRALYVKGKGDPSITTERLYNIVSELYHAGLRDVSDIWIDESWFDAERLAPGYEQEDTDRAYMAPSGAVSLNWNTVGVYLRSAGRDKKPAVEIEPPSDFFSVQSSLRSGFPRRFSVSSQPMAERQKISVRGSIPPSQGPVSVWKKIDHPPLYFGHTFRQLLKDRGIRVRGRVRLGTVPPSSHLLYVWHSEGLDVILKRVNKNSSNFIAEMLIKVLGAEVRGPPGTVAKGISVVEDFLEHEVGISRGSYVMKNGSGLNDANRFSTQQSTKLLRHMMDRFGLSAEYVSSLGIAGRDGTLRYRFEGSDAMGKLRAKTGTLENVSALSGYVQSASGEKFAFATVVNDYAGRLGPVVQSIDALGVAVAASGSAKGPTRAVAEVLPQPNLLGPLEEAKSRIKTYLALGKQGDGRNIPFLRTAWRSERDPAVRAVLAESIYRSNPQDYLGARALLDSVLATQEVYGRLRRVAREMAIETPGMSGVVELAAEGNAEALSRLLDISKAASADEGAEQELGGALAEVARTAPDELLLALSRAPDAEQKASVALLAKGLVELADAEHPFWPALKTAMGAVEPKLAGFAKQIDAQLSVRIAIEKQPKESLASPQAQSEVRPGG